MAHVHLEEYEKQNIDLCAIFTKSTTIYITMNSVLLSLIINFHMSLFFSSIIQLQFRKIAASTEIIQPFLIRCIVFYSL